jgi:predicted TIM-barrel fold metal-dependent hydrolase
LVINKNEYQERPTGNAMAGTRIDCDIHPAVGGTRTTLLPYLDDHWKEQVVSRAIDGLDVNSYPPSMPLSGRADWRPVDGSKPGSDLAMVQRGAFDQLGASHAICNVVYGAQAVFDPYMAAGFCKAINDWVAAEWLARDKRLRASIVVPMQAPDPNSTSSGRYAFKTPLTETERRKIFNANARAVYKL